MAFNRRKVRSKKIPGKRRVHIFLPPDVESDLAFLADQNTDGNRSAMVQDLIKREMVSYIKSGSRARGRSPTSMER
jgi:hypothetical protein